VRLPPPVGPGTGTVLAVGDSVLEGTAPLLTELLGDWDLEIDALQGRGLPDGLDQLEAHGSAQVVVVVLGHNYERAGEAFAWFEDLRQLTRGAERVVVATVAEWSPLQAEVNQAIWLLAAAEPSVVVADWASVVKANPSYLRSDDVHLTPEGNDALARLLAALVGDAPASR
jgi:lysophospholipase L1-like esterase